MTLAIQFLSHGCFAATVLAARMLAARVLAARPIHLARLAPLWSPCQSHWYFQPHLFAALSPPSLMSPPHPPPDQIDYDATQSRPLRLMARGRILMGQ